MLGRNCQGGGATDLRGQILIPHLPTNETLTCELWCLNVLRIQELLPEEYRKDRKIEPAIFDVSVFGSWV